MDNTGTYTIAFDANGSQLRSLVAKVKRFNSQYNGYDRTWTVEVDGTDTVQFTNFLAWPGVEIVERPEPADYDYDGLAR